MKILLTAFEPFDKLNTNSSLEVLKQVNAKDLIKLILPVSYKRGKDELIKAINLYKPDFVLCLGQAQGESKIRVEYVGLNYTRASISDNDGDYREKGVVYENSEAAIFTSYPIEDLVNKLNKITPTYLSLSAGGYICNTIYYTALKEMNSKALFIHLPLFDGQLINEKSLPLDLMVKVINEVIKELI